MKVSSISLNNFRNYREQYLEISEGVNVFYGNNAQGKTNILEAVNLFSGVKSHRGAKDCELINFDSEKGVVKINFESFGRENSAEIRFHSGKKKEFFSNGVKKKRAEPVLSTVMFCPEDLYMIKGGPAERRNFLNSCICPLKPSYLKILSDYGKVIENKNKLLKSDVQDDIMIKVWNEQLCDLGARIILYRKSFLEVLKPVLKSFHEKITMGENIEFEYISSGVDVIEDEKDVREKLYLKLEENSEKEKSAKLSLYGPHRDDIEFFINGRNVKNYGSQGQQRTVILGLKLSEIEIIKKMTGEYPVLLLDDILSELDKDRQNYLFEKIENHQVMITGTDAQSFLKSEKCKFFRVDNGCVYVDN